MFDHNDPFSDFDIENNGASSTPGPSGNAKRPQAKPPPSASKQAAAATTPTPTASRKGKARARAQHEHQDHPTNGNAAAKPPDTQPEAQDHNGDVEQRATIPPQLLTRILHGFFERDSTRLTKAANDAVARYIDVFVREAVARAAVGKTAGFLEVEDLEKVGPQLLLDM